MKRSRKDKSLFNQYLIRYISIALAGCILLGCGLFLLSTNQMEHETLTTAENNLSYSLEDFTQQLTTMREIASRIKIQTYYQPFILEQNGFRRLELIDDFYGFLRWVPLTENFYLYYPALGTVFSPRYEYTFDLFARSFMKTEPDALQPLIEQSNTFLLLPARSDTVLAVFPIHFYKYYGSTDAYLIYELELSVLHSRYTLSGNISELFDITWNGESFFKTDFTAPSVEVSTALPGGELRFSAAAFTQDGYRYYNRFQSTMLYIIITLTVLLCVAAVMLAYRSYRPIRRLADNAGLGHRSNEIRQIEMHLNELKTSRQDNMDRLMANLQEMKRLQRVAQQNILLHILNGEYNDLSARHALAADMQLQYDYYLVLCVTGLADGDAEIIDRCAQELSGEKRRIYATMLPEHPEMALLVCADAQERFAGIASEMETRMAQCGIRASVHRGTVCTKLHSVPYSLRSAESAAENEQHTPGIPTYQAQVEGILRSLCAGSRDAADEQLAQITGDIAQHVHSYLVKRYIFVDVIHQLTLGAENIHVALPGSLVEESLLSYDTEEFSAALTRMMDEIENQVQARPQEMSENTSLVLDYIRAHAFDSNLSLDSIAGALNISKRHITRLIKQGTDITFKEYITALRIEKAKEMLQQGKSTKEISDTVGYMDESYFLRIFREQVGMNISQYRTSMKQ